MTATTMTGVQEEVREDYLEDVIRTCRRRIRVPDQWYGDFLATLGANAEFYAPYQDNAKRWYRYSQERVPFINHAIIHPRVAYDIQGTNEWVTANQYAGAERIFDGSLGTLYGIKFWETDKAKVFTAAGSSSAARSCPSVPARASAARRRA